MFAPAQVDAMHARLAQVAADLGVPFSPRPHAPSTKPALAVSIYAQRQGKLDAWREAGMNAHWRDGLDIEDREVLRDLARASGLDADEAVAFLDSPEVPKLLAEQRVDAARWGVTGIPTWFLLPAGWDPGDPRPAEDEPQPVRVVGCQPMNVVTRAAEVAGATRRSSLGS